MQKNLILIPSLALASVAAYGQKKAKNVNAPAPGEYNVVLIISDQMSARILPLYGNNTIETPNIDRLAREGVTFDNSICAVPFSSPTRSSFVTGLYPIATTIITNVEPGKGNGPLDVNMPITESILFDKGYLTGHFGKWHLGPINTWACYADKKYARDIYDRSYFGGFAEKRAAMHPTPAPARKGEALTNAKTDQGFGLYQTQYAHDKFKNGPAEMKKLLGTYGRLGTPAEMFDWTCAAKDGTDFIKANKERRFMLTVSLGPPHPDYVAPDPWYSNVDPSNITLPPSSYIHPERYRNNLNYLTGQYLGEEGTKEKMRCYYAQTLFIDDMVGRILNTLDETGLADNTIVVFISDHGDPLSTQGMLYGKTIEDFLEEQLRVPTLMRLPGVIPAGKRIKASFSSVDLAPTMRDYLGINTIPTQGRSFRGIIDGKEKDEIGFAVCQRMEARSIRGEVDGKIYIYNKMFNTKGKNKTYYEQLWNITDDPYQMVDLIDNSKYDAVKKRLKAEYNKYADKNGDRRIEDLPGKGLVTWGNFRNVEPSKPQR